MRVGVLFPGLDLRLTEATLKCGHTVPASEPAIHCDRCHRRREVLNATYERQDT